MFSNVSGALKRNGVRVESKGVHRAFLNARKW